MIEEETHENQVGNDLGDDDLLTSPDDSGGKVADSISTHSRCECLKRKPKFGRFYRHGKNQKTCNTEDIRSQSDRKIKIGEKKCIERCKKLTERIMLSAEEKANALQIRTNIENETPTRKQPCRIPKSVSTNS